MTKSFDINEYFKLHASKKEQLKNKLNELALSELPPNEASIANKFLDLAFKYNQIPSKQFKKLSKDQVVDQVLEKLLKTWFKKYINATLIPPSKRIAKARNAVNDPALEIILRAYYEARTLSVDNVHTSLQDHSLLMSAENIQGNLLEEYISENISISPYNFIWCKGDTITAADFFFEKTNQSNEKSLYLLQIKNKYNTENSSSKKIRDNTNIEIWHRLTKKQKKGRYIPVFNWDELNEEILSLTKHNPELNEDDYRDFLRNAILNNPNILL